MELYDKARHGRDKPGHDEKANPAASFDADAAGLDRHRPFRDFALHEFREIFGRGAILGNDDEPGAFELVPQRRGFHRLHRWSLLLLADPLWRALPQEKRLPRNGLHVQTLLHTGGKGWQIP